MFVVKILVVVFLSCLFFNIFHSFVDIEVGASIGAIRAVPPSTLLNMILPCARMRALDTTAALISPTRRLSASFMVEAGVVGVLKASGGGVGGGFRMKSPTSPRQIGQRLDYSG